MMLILATCKHFAELIALAGAAALTKAMDMQTEAQLCTGHGVDGLGDMPTLAPAANMVYFRPGNGKSHRPLLPPKCYCYERTSTFSSQARAISKAFPEMQESTRVDTVF